MSTQVDNAATVASTINRINTVVVGTAPSEAQGITYESLAHSLSLLMHNAAQAQFGAKQIEIAAVAAVCSQIVKAGARAP